MVAKGMPPLVYGYTPEFQRVDMYRLTTKLCDALEYVPPPGKLPLTVTDAAHMTGPCGPFTDGALKGTVVPPMVTMGAIAMPTACRYPFCAGFVGQPGAEYWNRSAPPAPDSPGDGPVVGTPAACSLKAAPSVHACAPVPSQPNVGGLPE